MEKSLSMKSNGTNSVVLSVSHQKTANVLYGFEALIREHFNRKEIEIQSIMLFLLVVQSKELIDLSYIATTLSISKSAAGRNFYKLEKGNDGTGGLELLAAEVDYSDRRRSLIKLTPKGRKLAILLTEHVSKGIGRINHVDSE